MSDLPLACIVDTLENMLTTYANGHGRRVEKLAVHTGISLNGSMALNDNDIITLGYAARLHDFGKLLIPGEILHKEGVFTPAERALMQEHCQKGLDVTATTGLPMQVRLTMLYHHEHFNGGGYPRGLSGDDIPLFARIVGICDVWDALTSDRSYRKAYSKSMARRIMEEMNGRFDPKILSVFWKVLDDAE